MFFFFLTIPACPELLVFLMRDLRTRLSDYASMIGLLIEKKIKFILTSLFLQHDHTSSSVISKRKGVSIRRSVKSQE